MSPAELLRLEELVDEARQLRQRLHEITVMRERVLEMHGPQASGARRAIRIEMLQGHCVLIFQDCSSHSREYPVKVGVQDGIDIVEALLSLITQQQETLQKKLEGLKL